MKIFHRHKWRAYTGSGLGVALKLKTCGCGRHETLMYDIHKKKLVWVEGNFFEDISSPIFIVAADYQALKDVLYLVPKDTAYIQISFPSDLELMKAYRNPRFILAKDWKDTDVSELDDFRVLLMTRHF